VQLCRELLCVWQTQLLLLTRGARRRMDWCCLQFVAPRHVLQRAPKGWWMDLAWLMTHLAWQERSKWPAAIGQVTEFNLIPALGQLYSTLAVNELYVDVERILGPEQASLYAYNRLQMG